MLLLSIWSYEVIEEFWLYCWSYNELFDGASKHSYMPPRFRLSKRMYLVCF